jgi:acetyltransferase-like isoleucine patch superfamily enzyme
MMSHIMSARQTIKSMVKAVLKCGIPVTTFSRPFFSALYTLHVLVRETGIWVIRFFYYEPLFRSQCRQIGKGLWMEKLPYIVNRGAIHIGRNVRLSGKPSFGFSTRLYPEPSITIGDNTFVGHQTAFSAGKSIVIGNDCLIAGGVQISDNDGHPLDYLDRMKHLPPRMEDVKEVLIGNNVWIGGNAVILKGVTIGDRAIVGARAVVTRDVPPDTVVAGNPARVIKNLVK